MENQSAVGQYVQCLDSDEQSKRKGMATAIPFLFGDQIETMLG